MKRIRLLCTKFHELDRVLHPPVSICSHILPIVALLYSIKLFEFPSPIHWCTSHRSFSKKLPMQHSACLLFMMLCSKQTSIVQKRTFLSMFSCVTCLNHFLHARIPDMQNFVPRIPPSKSRLEVDVKISIMDATEPTPKTSDVTMASTNLNLFLMDTLQKLLAKTARLADCKWQSISKIAFFGTGCRQHAS